MSIRIRETLTETGNARRLVHDHGRDVRFCHGLGWLVWDSRRLEFDHTGEMSRRAQRTIDRIETAELSGVDDEKEFKRLAKHVQVSRTARAYRSMLEIASSDLRVLATAETLDANPELLNVSNGTLDLTTGNLRPPDPSDLITKLADVVYDPSATCPRWTSFLEWIVPDPEVRRFLQGAVGASITDEPREQLLIVLSGIGANGKTTVLETIAAVLGDYAVQLPDAMLLARRRASGAPEPELLTLRGGRFIAGVESGEGRALDEVRVKRLTGGDTILARGLYSNTYIRVTPRGHIFYATNHKPDVRGMDVGMWRRVAVVPFDVQIPEGERDPGWRERVLRDERSGILNWMLEGYRQWKADGASRPAAVVAAGAEYKADMDALGAFIADRCVSDAMAETPLTELARAFNEWAKGIHVAATSPQHLGPELRGRGHTVEKKWHGTGASRKQGRIVEGLRLVDDTLL